MPSIETDRLLIRAFETGDLIDIGRILDQARAKDSNPEEDPAQRERQSWLDWSILNQEWLPKLRQPPYGDRAVVLKSAGSVIGAVGLVPLLAPFDQFPELRGNGSATGQFTPEVGLYWVIDHVHRRRGYALEAARALVALAFTELHLKRILATTEHTNAASQGVMRALGMAISHNPRPTPEWLQIVGILRNPG